VIGGTGRPLQTVVVGLLEWRDAGVGAGLMLVLAAIVSLAIRAQHAQRPEDRDLGMTA
jgi:hypothetical protein